MLQAGANVAQSVASYRGWGRVRRLAPTDRDAVLEHLEMLSCHDREMRFGCALSCDALSRYADSLDFDRDIVLGLEDLAMRLIGMVQVMPLGPRSGAAEIAFSVIPAWRGLGLGHRLMKAAVAHARSCGLCRLVAQVRPSNKAMLAVFRAAGMRLEREAGETVGVLELTAEPIAVQTVITTPSSEAAWNRAMVLRPKLSRQGANGSLRTPPFRA